MMLPTPVAVVVVATGGTGMTVHHARVIAFAAVLVGGTALSPYNNPTVPAGCELCGTS